MWSERLLLFTGSLVPENGVDLLLETLPLLIRRHAIQLVVDGDGPQGEQLRQRAAELGVADRVHFVGKLDEVGLASLCRHADVAVIPPRDELAWHGAQAAMEAGVPLVAPNVGGPAGVVRHEVTGLSAIPGNRLSLAEQIDRVLVDRVLAKRLAQAAQQEALGDRLGARF